MMIRKMTKRIVSVVMTRAGVSSRAGMAWLRARSLAELAIVSLALIALPAAIITGAHLRAVRYHLSSATQALVGPASTLDKQLTLDKKTKAYRYNAAAAEGIKDIAGSGESGKQTGGSKYYGVTLASRASKGQTFADATTKLSFSLIPQFGQMSGQHESGHIVYPFAKGQVVYTLKDNGLKEDVVLTNPTDKINLSYKLQLPPELEARLMSDGSVGIYSADASLFGNMSYGSSADQQSVAKARTSSKKTNLVFVLPAPSVIQTGASQSSARASFTLSGKTLKVSATGLKSLHYPISIDPSVIVNAANGFASGNPEDNSATTSGGNLIRMPLGGGSLGSTWTTAGGTSFTTGRFSLGAAVLNGFAYVAGGNTGAAQVNTVFYAPITGPGTVGTWNSTHATTDGKDYEISMVAYNGYLYMLAGNQDSNQAVTNVWYAAQCTGTNVTTVFPTNCAVGSTAGTISGWNTTTSLNTGRIRQTAAVYNGYVYVIGGCTSSTGAGCTATTGIVGNLEYAKINVDGTLGSWTVSSSAALARYGQQSAVYNGNLYVMGGCTALTSSNCSSSATNDAWFAPLDPSSGAPGTWVQTNVFSGGSGVRMGGVATTYNGYMYVVGGCINSGSAPGCNSQTPLTTSSYAPIYANGQLGPWSTSAPLLSGLRDLAGFEYGGYLFMAGGCSSQPLNCNSGSGGVNTATSIAINSLGAVGTYASMGAAFNSPPTFGSAVTTTGGYIYVLGGDSNGGANAVNTGRFAKLGADGTVGTWAAIGTNFTGVRSNASATAYNGYIYLSGGESNTATSAVNNVQVGTINTSTGNVSSWSTSSSFPVSAGTGGRAMHGSAAYNGYLYLVGGITNSNSITLSDTAYAPINADGTLGSWTDDTTHTLSSGLNSIGMVAYDGYLYSVGGRTSGNTSGTVSSVLATQLSPTGGIGTWNSAGNMTGPGGRYGIGLTASNGYVYLVAGTDGSSVFKDTWYATIGSGSIGSWTQSSDVLATSPATSTSNNANRTTGLRSFAGIANANGFMYVIGGCDDVVTQETCTLLQSDVLPDVQYVALNTGGGAVGSFSTANASTSFSARRDASTVVANGYMYIVGGEHNGLYTGINAASSQIQTNGQLGAWSTLGAGTVLSTARGAAVVAKGYIYYFGGYNGSSAQSTVRYAAIGSGGALGNWATAPIAMPYAQTRSSVTASNGYLYLDGGCTTSACTTLTNDVEYAAVCTGANTTTQFTTNCNGSSTAGTTSSWNSLAGTTPLPVSLQSASATVYNGYMYYAGGNNNTNDVGSVYYAALCTGANTTTQFTTNCNGSSTPGSTSSWSGAGDDLNLPRDVTQVVAADGYITVISFNVNVFTTDIQYAPIHADGHLGAWGVSPNAFTTARYGEALAVNDGSVYIAGGCTSAALNCNNGNSDQSDAQYAPIGALVRAAHFTKVIDLGIDVQLTRWYLAGTQGLSLDGSGNGTVSSSVTSATSSNPVFGSYVSDPGTLNSSILYRNIARYAFISVSIDETQEVTFPDNSPTTISEYDLFFHANPARRLRAGQTFTGTNQSTVKQLDTEGSP